MATRRSYFRTHRNAILDELLEHQVRPVAERVSEQMERDVERLLRQTLRFVTQFRGAKIRGVPASAISALRDAKVETWSEIDISRKGTKLSIKAVVTDGTGKVHQVWHIMDGGRGSFTQKNTSPPLRLYKGPRTIEDSLEVTGHRGYQDGVFVIRRGQRVGPIKARRWYRAAGLDLRRRAPRIPSLRTMGLEVVKVETKKLR